MFCLLKDNESRAKLEMAQQKQQETVKTKNKQAAVIGELMAKQPDKNRDKRMMDKTEIYDGALEDILTGNGL